MRVRATRAGYYDHLRRREGDVFTLASITGLVMDVKTGQHVSATIPPEKQFSSRWMEKVADTSPETRPVHFNKRGDGDGRLEAKLTAPWGPAAMSQHRTEPLPITGNEQVI